MNITKCSILFFFLGILFWVSFWMWCGIPIRIGSEILILGRLETALSGTLRIMQLWSNRKGYQKLWYSSPPWTHYCRWLNIFLSFLLFQQNKTSTNVSSFFSFLVADVNRLGMVSIFFSFFFWFYEFNKMSLTFCLFKLEQLY